MNKISQLSLIQSSAILEDMPDALVVVNSGGRIIFINHHTEMLFGYSRQELLGEFFQKLMPLRIRYKHADLMNGYFSDPISRPIGSGLKLMGMRADGTEVPVEIRFSPLRSDEGLLSMAAIRDVTIPAHLEEQLQLKNTYLEKIDLLKDQFMAGMSHELRTPLNAIIGFTGVLLTKTTGDINPLQERQLKNIETNSLHLLSIINDILDIAKIDAEQVDLHLEVVDCVELAQNVISTLKPLAEEKKIEIKVDESNGKVRIFTDRRILTQILINLLNNSIKFTDKGSVVIKVYLEKGEEEYAVFDIIDTGIGIKDEHKGKLFKAFKRIETSGSHKEGTGLGLYLSKKLADLIKGKIVFESKFGKGSIFSVLIPKY